MNKITLKSCQLMLGTIKGCSLPHEERPERAGEMAREWRA